jgi:hypothetical protein
MNAGALPPLEPVRTIDRRLSTPEHYHACIGTHSRTLEPRREVRMMLMGEGDLPQAAWQKALDAVAAVNPGLQLRLQPDRWPLRWRSDAPSPRVRWIDRCDWDARSQQGSAFISEGELSLEAGPSVELIVAGLPGGELLVALRGFHAVTDGSGALHALRELFRALRGEALLGTNAPFSDVQLMRSVGARRTPFARVPPCGLTGEPQGFEVGDQWRRLSLGRGRPRMLAQTAAAMARFAHRFSSAAALIAVPVDLRKHCPGLLSTLNFSNMLLVPMSVGEDEQAFHARLSERLSCGRDTLFPRVLDGLTWLPLPWLDRMLSRTRQNFYRRRPVETVVISNLGRFDSAEFSAPGFRTRTLFAEPLQGSAFSTLSCVDGQVEMLINLPHVLGGNGRFDALESYLRETLGDASPDAL